MTRLQWGEATSSNALWPVALALILTFAALLITDAMTDGAAAARLAGGLLRRWRLTAPLIAAFWLARLPMS